MQHTYWAYSSGILNLLQSKLHGRQSDSTLVRCPNIFNFAAAFWSESLSTSFLTDGSGLYTSSGWDADTNRSLMMPDRGWYNLAACSNSTLSRSFSHSVIVRGWMYDSRSVQQNKFCCEIWGAKYGVKEELKSFLEYDAQLICI